MQTLRIATAIPPLVMAQYNLLRAFPERTHPHAHLISDDRVLTHHLPLLDAQRTGLEQDAVGYADFTDVVQESAALDVGIVLMRHAHRLRQNHRERCHALAVPFYLPFTSLQRAQHRLQHVRICLVQLTQMPFVLCQPDTVSPDVALDDDGQFMRAPWLDDEVAGSCVQKGAQLLDRAVPCEDDHRYVRVAMTNMFQQFCTVHTWHAQVGETEVYICVRQYLESLLCALHRRYCVAVGVKDALDCLTNQRFIVYHKHVVPGQGVCCHPETPLLERKTWEAPIPEVMRHLNYRRLERCTTGRCQTARHNHATFPDIVSDSSG